MAGFCSVRLHQLPGNVLLQSSHEPNLHQERWSSLLAVESSVSCREIQGVKIYQAGDHYQCHGTKCSESYPSGNPLVQSCQFTYSANFLKSSRSRNRSSSSSSSRIQSSSSYSNVFYQRRHVSPGGFFGNPIPKKCRRRSGKFVSQEAWMGHCVCKFSNGNSIGSMEWMSMATPYEVLGVSEGCSEEEVKAAFRLRIKEYHPDVYQGPFDADAITQRLLKAYELLTASTERVVIRRKNVDPFEVPDGMATNLFVNELDCIGRGCPYSCVERAPTVFQFAPDTGRARVVNQDLASRQINDYEVQLAVGQCPSNCIHTLTVEQRLQLEEILQSVLEGTIYSSEVVIMDGLLARAKFENGRYQPPKRQPKKTEKWVDWF